MLTWWGIMLDVVDTPYRGGVLCLRGGALCSASVLLLLNQRSKLISQSHSKPL